MSFHVEFVATSPEEAVAIVQANPVLPVSVKDFLLQAFEGCKGSAVSVSAHGYLYADETSQYDNSTVNIVVKKIVFHGARPASTPKVKGPKAPKG